VEGSFFFLVKTERVGDLFVCTYNNCTVSPLEVNYRLPHCLIGGFLMLVVVWEQRPAEKRDAPVQENENENENEKKSHVDLAVFRDTENRVVIFFDCDGACSVVWDDHTRFACFSFVFVRVAAVCMICCKRVRRVRVPAGMIEWWCVGHRYS
jgi:hypothetical protein